MECNELKRLYFDLPNEIRIYETDPFLSNIWLEAEHKLKFKDVIKQLHEIRELLQRHWYGYHSPDEEFLKFTWTPRIISQKMHQMLVQQYNVAAGYTYRNGFQRDALEAERLRAELTWMHKFAETWIRRKQRKNRKRKL